MSSASAEQYDGGVTDQPPEPERPPEEPAADSDQPTRVEHRQAPLREPRRLHRSRDNRVLGGVCGGLGEYFAVDAVLFRIAFVLLIFAGGLGILAYVLAWIFMPEEPETAGAASESAFDRAVGPVDEERRRGALVLGLLFVGLGVLFLLDVAWPDFLSWRYVWPIALIAVGIAIVLRARR